MHDVIEDWRASLPFAWWILYDLVIGPLLVWGTISLSYWFIAGLVMLLPAVVFDVSEALVKWSDR